MAAIESTEPPAPAVLPRPRPNTRQRTVLRVASTSRRLVAGLVDLAPIGALSLAAYALGAGHLNVLVPADWGFLPEHLADVYNASPWSLLRPLLVPLAAALCWTGLWLAACGTTPGKWLTGLRVVGPDGEPIDAIRLLLRLMGYTASALSTGLGWWLSFVLPSRRALHDLISDSYVVHRR